MKISLALGARQPLSRQTAWGCLTTNVALPGFGSLLAGRPSGYPQAALALGGMALTVCFGLRFLLWYSQNAAHIRSPEADPAEVLLSMWVEVRWAVLGIALFAIGWLWALATSRAILRAAREAETQRVPPRL